MKIIGRKGMIGNTLTMIVATFAIFLILFLFSFYFIGFGGKECIKAEEQSMYVEDSVSLLAFLATPVEVSVSDKAVEMTVSELFGLVVLGGGYEIQLVDILDNTLEKTFGNCYELTFEIPSGVKVFGESIEEDYSLVSSVFLSDFKLTLKDAYAFCLIENSVEECDLRCGL